MGFYSSNNKENSHLRNDNSEDDFENELRKEIEVNSKRELTNEERKESGLYLQEFDPARGNEGKSNSEESNQNTQLDSYNENINSNINHVQTIKPLKNVTDEVDEEMRRQLSGNTKSIEEMLEDKAFLQTMKSIKDLTSDI